MSTTAASVPHASPALQEWRANWTLVLAAMIGMSFGSVPVSTIGLFMQPLEESFGWSRAMISSGLLVFAAVGLPLTPFAGALVDRFGARRCAIPGVFLSGSLFAVFSLMTGASWMWWFIWLIYSIASLLIRVMVWNSAVSNAFDASRGLAIGLVLCGIALTQIIAPPLTNLLIEEYGWRIAYAVIGLGWGGTSLFFVLLFFHGRSEPAAATTKAVVADQTPKTTPGGLTLKQALRDPSMRLIAFSVTLSMAMAASIGTHIVPLIESSGTTRTTAASLAALMGLGSVSGKIVTGLLSDRIASRFLPAVVLSIPAVGYFLLLNSGGAAAWLGFGAFTIGFGSGGAIQLGAYLTTRYAGMRSFGSIFGVLSSLLGVVFGIGPVIAGWLFDKTGSYELILTIAVPTSIVAGLSISFLGPHPEYEPIVVSEKG